MARHRVHPCLDCAGHHFSDGGYPATTLETNAVVDLSFGIDICNRSDPWLSEV